MDAAAPPPVCEPCDPPLRGWDRAAHVRYFLGLLSGLGNEYTGVETQRLSVVYFCVVGLDLLRALGVQDDMAHTSIRFGIGRFTTEAEVDYAVEMCVKHVDRLREMSPLYEMVQEGIDIQTIQWSNH